MSTSAHDRFLAMVASQSTPMLWGVAERVYSMPESEQREFGIRHIMAAVSDELTKRLDLGDALDAIFADEAFTGTYYDALRQAADLPAA